MRLCMLRLIGLCACLLISGCGGTPLDSSYGAVKRPSVNGIGVFIDLLRSQGRRVDVLPAISGPLSRYSKVILFHEGFDALPEDTVQFLHDGWDDHQTIVIVLRDSDWAMEYWEEIAKQLDKNAPPEAAAARRVSGLERALLLQQTSSSVAASPLIGYGLDAHARPGFGRATQVQGIVLDDEQASVREFSFLVDFPLRRRLTLPGGESQRVSAVWWAGAEPLMLTWKLEDGPRIYILGTAAPLLNAGLINPGNRQFAQKVMDLVADPEPMAVITSSLLLTEDEEISMWRFARIFPHPWILGQSLVALILFCWWKWPIFGRPHTDQSVETKRFGHHVAAVGEMLARTGNVRFAVQRIQEWQRVQEHRKGRRG